MPQSPELLEFLSDIGHTEGFFSVDAMRQYGIVNRLKHAFPDSYRDILAEWTLDESVRDISLHQETYGVFKSPSVYAVLPGAEVTVLIQKNPQIISFLQTQLSVWNSAAYTFVDSFIEDVLTGSNTKSYQGDEPDEEKGLHSLIRRVRDDDYSELELEISDRLKEAFNDTFEIHGTVIQQPNEMKGKKLLLETDMGSMVIEPGSVVGVAVYDLQINPDEYDATFVYCGKPAYVWDARSSQWQPGRIDHLQSSGGRMEAVISTDAGIHAFDDYLNLPRNRTAYFLGYADDDGLEPSETSVSFHPPETHPYDSLRFIPSQVIETIYGRAVVLKTHGTNHLKAQLQNGAVRDVIHEQVTSRPDPELAAIIADSAAGRGPLIQGTRIVLTEGNVPVIYRVLYTDPRDGSAAIQAVPSIYDSRNSINVPANGMSIKKIPVEIAVRYSAGLPESFSGHPVIGKLLEYSSAEGSVTAEIYWKDPYSADDEIFTSVPGRKVDLRLLPLGITVIDKTSFRFVPAEHIVAARISPKSKFL